MEQHNDGFTSTNFIYIGVLLLIAIFLNYASSSHKNKKKVKFNTGESQRILLSKPLSLKDQIVVDMLSLQESAAVSWILTDPVLPDNPIALCSDGFCHFTGYEHDEIVGKNCRFLQGKDTKKEDVDKIRNAIKSQSEASVCLLNYKKDGTSFINQFFICPLYTPEYQLAYYLGVQTEVAKFGPGQQAENPGWVYTLGLHQ